MEKFPGWFQKMLNDLPDEFPEDKLSPLNDEGVILGELDQELRQIFNLIITIQNSSEKMVLDHARKHQLEKNYLKTECCEDLLLKINFFSNILRVLSNYFQFSVSMRYPKHPNIIICEGWKVVSLKEGEFNALSEETNGRIDQIINAFNSVVMNSLAKNQTDSSVPFIVTNNESSDLN